MLSDKLDTVGVSRRTYIYPDSAEPKSNTELKDLGWIIKPSEKGADSVRAGINYMLSLEVYYTRTSVNIEKEVQGYVWKLDRNKNPTNEPIDDFNHAIDAIRYGLMTSKKTSFPNIQT
jgi:phage terminase large subunit